jgi:predicted RNase H-like HicB family nuclease
VAAGKTKSGAIGSADEDAQGNPAWFARCPALESIGAATSGRTREEALRRANEVVRMIVQEFIEDGKPLRLSETQT